MTPILEGLDGVQKMSKSLGNCIGITEPPAEMYGKLMSINDELMWKYWVFLTDLRQSEVDALRAEVEAGHPQKQALAAAYNAARSDDATSIADKLNACAESLKLLDSRLDAVETRADAAQTDRFCSSANTAGLVRCRESEDVET